MSNLVQSLEHAVEAGVKGIIGIADCYMGGGRESGAASPTGTVDMAKLTLSSSASNDQSDPIAIAQPEATPDAGPSSAPAQAPAPSLASRIAAASQDSLVQLTDVPSGWIHLQSTYLDAAGGQRRVRSFGLRNLSSATVDVEIASDLGAQVLFFVAEDDASSSSSSSSSFSAADGQQSLTLTLPALTATTVWLAFQPSTSTPSSPSGSVPSTDDGFTPRVAPNAAGDLSPVPGGRLPSAAGSSVMSDGSSMALSTISSSSVAGSSRDGFAPPAAAPRRSDPIHRAFSVHGSILVHATTQEGDVLTAPAHQNITLPFFATVCRSFFSTAAIDPATGVAAGSQTSNGKLVIDFGSDNVVGAEVHRDIILVNRSEIDLVWTTAILNCRFKDSVWFSLRDLDSENVFGADTSPEPMPLPALSSRHLRLALRAKGPVTDFDFDFVISNVHQSGNAVTVRALGSCLATSGDDMLRITNGSSLDFGQIPDGTWTKRLMVMKNAGDRPIDVHFSATPGYEVVFRLAGVAGEDIDEDMPTHPVIRDKRHEALSRQSTRDSRSRETSGTFSSRFAASETSSPGQPRSQLFVDAIPGESGDDWSAPPASDRDSSMAPSRPLSRVTSRSSSYRPSRNDGESDDDDSQHYYVPPMDPPQGGPSDNLGDRDIPNQIEELTCRPGTEYRVFAMYRPVRDLTNPPEIAGKFRSSSFKVYLDSAPSASRSRPAARSRKVLHCSAESCTSFVSIPSGHQIDFGEVTVGASKSTTITIENLSALSARVEIAAISKVLNTNRNVIIIPPYETVQERIDFFPRRINDHYEKQVFVRNHLNRSNNQLIEVRSKNVDVYNVTLHSHLYRILTPSGSNFLDFGSVIINSPSVRTVQFQNLTHKPLVLDLSASQPEDVELYVKASDAPITPIRPEILAKYAALEPDRPANGNLKERFVESLQDKDGAAGESKAPVKSKGAARRERSATRGAKSEEKTTIGANLVSALKKGARGRPVQLYGNAVVFKDRSLLDDSEYLDLAAGPPTVAHRQSSNQKRHHLLETIALEDKSKLSGLHPRVPNLDFAALAKSSGLYVKDELKRRKTKSSAGSKREPQTPTKRELTIKTEEPVSPSQSNVLKTPVVKNGSATIKSPALTGKRAELKTDPANVTDAAKLSPDELIVALEHHDQKRSASAAKHFSPDEEDQYVRRLVSLRKELQNAVNNGKFVPARVLTVPPGASRQLVVVMTPNGSTRPHVTTRAKRAESRIFIKLLEYDKSLLTDCVGKHTDLSELPVRDLVIRSSCVRSVLEVQQSSINFGTCERGEVKSRTIVIHNKSDCVGVFRMRTSGSIASGNLKLGLGRYGVVSAFGRKEVASFSFTPSMVGNYNETIVVENVLDSFNDQNVLVKATVRKMPTFSLDLAKIDFAPSATGAWPNAAGFVLTNTSKVERTFVVEVPEAPTDAFAELSLARDEKDAGQALSKGEEEEVEGILQKLKIARRKNKPDKIAKYEKRLSELGVVTAPPEDAAAADDEDGKSGAVTPTAGEGSTLSLAVTLQANKKAKILVHLVQAKGPNALATTIKVFERKNTDETVTIDVSASPNPVVAAAAQSTSANSSEDPLNLAIMQHCLDLTLQCPVSPTAFCVGSTLFYPKSAPFYYSLQPHFSTFPDPTTGEPAGLILADGYSRQIPGNTHAEANALANFHARMDELEEAATPEGEDTPSLNAGLPSASEILSQADCYATMEPCSVRTSGGPSCALELVRAHVKRVYLGVEEPPDFVQCEGVRILEQGNVEVARVLGLEEQCLSHARRGRN